MTTVCQEANDWRGAMLKCKSNLFQNYSRMMNISNVTNLFTFRCGDLQGFK